MIDWNHPGPTVPDCGAYAIRPYASDSLFLSVRVGAYCIRPTRRSRQGDECGYPVVSMGNLLGLSGPYRARSWGVCHTPLHLRSIVWDHFTNRPYTSGRLFSSEWVGAYCIRPIRRSRQGDEGGYPVISQGILLGSSGPCPSSAMGWGLAPTGPHLLFLS